MLKHFRRVVTICTPPAALGGYLLTHDIPATLRQADKSASQIASAFGASSPPQHMATYCWTHPILAILVFLLLFGAGVALSWAIEGGIRWARIPAPPSPDAFGYDDHQEDAEAPGPRWTDDNYDDE